jgi:peptidoglycan-associated lipoprotein
LTKAKSILDCINKLVNIKNNINIKMEEIMIKSYKILTISLLAVILIAGAGCNMFDSQIPPNDPVKADIPKTAPPEGVWTDGIDMTSTGGLTKDGWRPIENVTLPTIYFAYDRSTIGTTERQKLDQVAKYLNGNATFGLIVEGHCDEKGSAEYNRALGERRAIAVRDYLKNSGVSENRIKTMSYGEDRLVYKANTEVAHAKNRRAQLILARTR